MFHTGPLRARTCQFLRTDANISDHVLPFRVRLSLSGRFIRGQINDELNWFQKKYNAGADLIEAT